jgi:hypothetical protein
VNQELCCPTTFFGVTPSPVTSGSPGKKALQLFWATYPNYLIGGLSFGNRKPGGRMETTEF